MLTPLFRRLFRALAAIRFRCFFRFSRCAAFFLRYAFRRCFRRYVISRCCRYFAATFFFFFFFFFFRCFFAVFIYFAVAAITPLAVTSFRFHDIALERHRFYVIRTLPRLCQRPFARYYAAVSAEILPRRHLFFFATEVSPPFAAFLRLDYLRRLPFTPLRDYFFITVFRFFAFDYFAAATFRHFVFAATLLMFITPFLPAIYVYIDTIRQYFMLRQLPFVTFLRHAHGFSPEAIRLPLR